MNPLDAFLSHKRESEKTAGFMSALGRGITYAETPAKKYTRGEQFAHVLGQQMTLGTALAGIGAAGLQAGKGVSYVAKMLQDKYQKPREYKAMMDAHPELHKHDAGKVQMAYNSLRHMAPTMAKEPLVAGSFVRNILAMETEGGLAVPTETAKMLADTESKMHGVQDKDSDSMWAKSMMAPNLQSMTPAPNTPKNRRHRS